jgi:hypothetical protein
MRGTVFVLLLFFSIAASGQTDSLLIELNRAILQREVYEAPRLERLKALHRQLSTAPASQLVQRYNLLLRLSDEYKSFIYDSAFVNSQRLLKVAYALGDRVRITDAKNRLGFVLLSSGMFKETLDSLASLSMNGMPDSVKVNYYFIMSRTYYDLIDFDQDRFYTPRYLKLGNAYLDSAIKLSPARSYNHLYFSGLKNLKNENNHEAVDVLEPLLKSGNLTEHQVAIISSTFSYYYTSRGLSDEAIELLARAAIGDIKSAVRETTALSFLAELLYRKGDIVDAYVYIQEAMDDAVFYGARQRKTQVGSVLPIIAAAQLSNVDGQRKLWLMYSTLITVLAVMVIMFAFITVKELRRRRKAEKALMESNRIKEEYIGYYFNVNSEYVSKIEAIKKAIEMKLLTRKVDDIKETVNNINLKKEREELYTSFDQIFLKLFPDFVTVFNSYFSEQDRIVLKEGQLLNTELRIFALIRMGIHDTEKIARILDYSINTIYNYKARVKGKALLPNEEFEKKIMEIQPE